LNYVSSALFSVLFCSIVRHPPGSALFPYTTLFRSRAVPGIGGAVGFAAAPIRVRPADGRVGICAESEARRVVAGVEHVRSGANSDRKSTRLNSSHDQISYAVFCLKKKNEHDLPNDR